MASVQEMETKLAQVERKIDFAMKSIKLMQQSPLVGMPPRVVSLLDLYTESQRAGLTIAEPDVKEGEVVNG